MEWYFYGLLTPFLAAAAAIISKKTLFKEHAMEFSAALAFVIALGTLPFIPFINFSEIPPIAFSIIAVSSMVVATAFLLVSKSVRHMPISISSPLVALGPAITAVSAFLILGERLKVTGVAGLVLIIIGVFIMELNGRKPGILFRRKHFWYIMAALVLYSLSSLADRFILGPEWLGINPVDYLVLMQFFVAVDYIVLMSFFHDGVRGIIGAITKEWKPIFYVALFTLAYRLTTVYALSFQGGKVALVLGLKRSSALIATLIGGRMFHDDMLFQRGFSAILILSGVLLVIL